MFAAPAFTSFLLSFEADLPATGMSMPIRVGAARQTVPENSPIPAWAKPDGRPSVFVALGTMASISGTAPIIMRHFLEALSTLPVRALISTGQNFALGAFGPVPGKVTVVERVPQDEIFPVPTHWCAMVGRKQSLPQ